MVLNDNLNRLNDLQLQYKILPQISLALPDYFQIRITLNKHENVSHFKNVLIPSILFINEDNVPVFCYRSNGDHFIHKFNSNNNIKKIQDFRTKEFEDNFLKSTFEKLNKTHLNEDGSQKELNDDNDFLKFSKKPVLEQYPSLEKTKLEKIK